MATFTRGQLKARINGGIKGKIGIITDINGLLNQIVREVTNELDLRSHKRKARILPGLFDDVTQYGLPADIKGYKIISLQDYEDKVYSGFDLVPFEEWGKNRKLGTIAFKDEDMIRTLLVSFDAQGTTTVLSGLDSITDGGGAWVGFGDAVNVMTDSEHFMRGSGSVKFDISAAAGTTAGLENSALTATDKSAFFGSTGSVFVFADIFSPTDITNYEVRIGTSPTDYRWVQASVAHGGNAFVAGTNLLRFDLSNYQTVGSPDMTAVTYFAVFMNKAVTKISEPNYRFDHIVFATGDVHNIVYYSKFPWESATGARMQDSTVDGDFIVCDSDEFELFVQKGIEYAAYEVDEENASSRARNSYQSKGRMYINTVPSDAMLMQSTYMEFI